MIKYVDKTCEYCGAELIHVPTNRRFCSECSKIRHRELNRERDRRKRGIYKDPLWREREQVQETGDKGRYENRLRRLIDDYRYGARHSVNEAVIRQIKSIGKKLKYTAAQINNDIERAKLDAQRGIKSYHATPEEIKRMLGE